MRAVEEEEVQHQLESLQSLLQELNIPVDDDLGHIVNTHSCPNSRKSSETRTSCCPVHGYPQPPSPPPPPLPPRPDRSARNPSDGPQGLYKHMSVMPSTASLFPASQPPPPRSPRATREAPSSPHHFPHPLKRRGSLTRLNTNGSGGAESPHHQQRRGSDNSTTGVPGPNSGPASPPVANTSGSGGTLGRSKGSSSSGGLLLHADPYELSEELKEHEVVMLERKYSGRMMTPHRAARVIQRNFREFVVKKQFQMLRTERRPNRRLEHLQRSTSMLVDGDGVTPTPHPAPLPPVGPGILHRAILKQANSFEDVLLERAYSTCWSGAEPEAKAADHHGNAGGSRDSGVDADQQQPGGRREGVPPSHSTSTTSMNSAATDSSGSSSSGISSTTAATVVAKQQQQQQQRQGAVWQQQQAAAAAAAGTEAGGPALHHHHHHLLHQHHQQQAATACSCHHHHHNHHSHPAHSHPVHSHPGHHRPAPAPTAISGVGHGSGHGSRANYAASSSPSPASSHSSVLSRDRYTPPAAPHTHSLSSERKRKRMYRVGLHIFNKKPERGLQFMMEKNFVASNPLDVAQFLFTRKGLSRRMVGEYLGLLNNRFAQQVLDHYVELMDFRGLDVDEALRLCLSHFQMMGESQKVSKYIEVFTYFYAKANPDWMVRNLRHWDTLFTLAYGIVMLHTDLYNPSVKSKRMKPEDFVNNLREIDRGANLDPNLLIGIYNRIKANKFKLLPDHTDMVRNITENLRSSSSSKSSSSSEVSAHAANKDANPGMHLVANLIRSHRRLVCYCRLYEVTEMSKKEKPGAHLREVFLFNDMLLVTKPVVKRISKEKINYYRKHFSLHNVQVYLFESPYYPYGVQIKSSLDGTVLATFHHPNENDRSGFVDDLHESVLELSYVESMRIEGELQQQHRRATAAAIVTSTVNSNSSASPRPPPPPVPQAASASRANAAPSPNATNNRDNRDNNATQSEHDLLSLQAAHEQLQAAAVNAMTSVAAGGGPRPNHSHPGANVSSTGSGNRYSADSGVAEQEFGSGTRTFYV